MNKGRIVVVAGLAVLAAGWRASGFGMGIVTATHGAEALYSLVNAWTAELKEETATDANRMKLMDRLRQAREALAPIKDAANNTLPTLEQRLAQLQTEHNNAPLAEWAAKDRAEFERTQSARDSFKVAAGNLNVGWEDLRWMQERMQKQGFDPFRNAEFKQHFDSLGKQVGKAHETFQAFQDKYNVETKDPGNADSGWVVVPATKVTISSTAKDMAFEVNGTWLRPAKGKEPAVTKGEVRLGDHRELRVRALSWDPTRQRIVTVVQRFEAGEMGTAKLREKDAESHYLVNYGTAELGTIIRSESEEYVWKLGHNVDLCVGKATPWGRDTAIVAAPVVSETPSGKDIPAGKGARLGWLMPAVENQSVEFTFSVTATVRYTVARQLAAGRTTSNEESQVSTGELSVTVAPR